MTGSATNAAAAIKAFFMSSSPRLFQNLTSVGGGWGLHHQLRRGIYTPQLVRCKESGRYGATRGQPVAGRQQSRLTGLRSSIRARTAGTISGRRTRSVAVAGDWYFQPKNTATLLLPAINLRARHRGGRAGRGFCQIRVGQRYIRIGGPGIQGLVYQIDVRGAAVDGRRR